MNRGDYPWACLEVLRNIGVYLDVGGVAPEVGDLNDPSKSCFCAVHVKFTCVKEPLGMLALPVGAGGPFVVATVVTAVVATEVTGGCPAPG